MTTQHLGWANKLTQLTPLWDVARLGTLRNSKGFHSCDLIGISQLGDLWRGGKVVDFKYLQEQFQMAKGEWYRYMQIRHALETNIPPGMTPPASSPLENRLLTDHLVKKATSLTYKKIINNRPDPLQHLREVWQSEIGDMEDPDWREALASPKEVITTSTLRLVQLKILHRIYYTRQLLHKVGKIKDSNCLRRCGEIGDFYHTIWRCPIILSYWEAVLNTLKEVCKKHIPVEPKCCLLNIWEPTDLNRA